jgi:preprotein translocase subunit SecD
VKGYIVASASGGRSGRPLLGLLVVTALLALWTFWPNQGSTPKLGLDLRGGTQVTLTPRVTSGTITDTQLNEAVNIIRQRVNGLGVAEAEVSTQGSGNNAAIIVSVPGVSEQGIADVLKQTALLDFRPVPTASPSASPSASANTLVAPIQAATSQELADAYKNLDCSNPAARQGGTPDDPTKWVVTCSRDGATKYLLQPAFIKGTAISDAKPESSGTAWQVSLSFDGEGTTQLAEASKKLYQLSSPQNQFAIVLDGLVFSSPYFQEPILGGKAQITGNFTVEEATNLANILRYGALPLTLDLAEVTSLSPTLGQDQLNAGLLAGGLGLLLVGVYLLFYYRALGVVAGASLVVAAIITYFFFVILGRQLGFTLTLAGIAGAIVAVGITADSFVVYFERIRDEIREGKSMRTAVVSGWARARKTILAADAVSMIGAVVLYYLSIGSVRGFAFTLGLTTAIDVAIAFLFTKPTVTMFGRSKWFAKGSKWTGLDPERLGVTSVTAAHSPSAFAQNAGE